MSRSLTVARFLVLALATGLPSLALAQWEDEEEAPSRRDPAPQPEAGSRQEPAAGPGKTANGYEDWDGPAARPPPKKQKARQDDEEEAPRSDVPRAPSKYAITLGLGGAIHTLGGIAEPRLTIRGAADRKMHAPGLGPAFTLHLDFPLADLDWRTGVQGALPGYLGLQGTAGIKKDLGKWDNPKVTARGGAGLEVMLGHVPETDGKAGFTYLVPVVLGQGETAIDYELVPDRFRLGAAMEAAVRIGLPIGFGFSFAGYLRAGGMF